MAQSIESDVDNFMRLVSTFNVLPKGLYADAAINVAKRELALECDYKREAAAQTRFKVRITAACAGPSDETGPCVPAPECVCPLNVLLLTPPSMWPSASWRRSAITSTRQLRRRASR